MKLKSHLSDREGLADLLNYAHLIEDGILINKDGAFLMTYKFRGPDINSATTAELDALAESFNRMALFLEDGWMLHLDEIRVPSINYPEEGHFPDTVSKMLDEERRQLYELEGSHFENLQFLTFVWKFPMPLVSSTQHWFVEGKEQNASAQKNQNLSNLLEYFLETVNRCINLLSLKMIFERLGSKDLLSFLNTCITGELLPVAVPNEGGFIDVALARAPLLGGYYPKIGDKHIRILTLQNYLNDETLPGWLEDLCTYPMVYRFSSRFIPLSEASAEKEIKRYQKDWNNKVKGLVGVFKEAIFDKPTKKLNTDALNMANQTDIALTENSSRKTRFGYLTSEIVFMDENQEKINEAIKEIKNYCEQKGFKCLEETVNAMDAWLGTIPGHGSCNVRRIFSSSATAAHLLPLQSIWAGSIHSPKSSLLPPYSPPVFYAATTGKTPFRFHTDVEDVGHQMVIGPTGAGKSTYLGLLVSQFLRYENAQIFLFDKDYSHQGLTHALEGYYYDIGNAEELSFCPLADLSSESKLLRAVTYVENLVELQNVNLTPDIRRAIYQAMRELSAESHKHSRNITVLRSIIQHQLVREALTYYTLQGQLRMIDATEDHLKTGHLQTFEMSWLLEQRPEIYLPVLLYIFGQIENRLDDANGKNPTLIVLEEAWLYIMHPFFANKLRDWLKTLRKKNARVVFVTQSLSDLYDPESKSLTKVTASLMESCPTKIYLPNKIMDVEMRELYKKIGLNDRQIEILYSISVPKRHYYVVTPHGNRLIDLGLSDQPMMALSFLGLSKEKSKNLIETKKHYGKEWVYQWLTQNGNEAWINYGQENSIEGVV